jgi:hypothetical protein
MSIFAGKTALSASAPTLEYWRKGRKAPPRKTKNMNARPEIRQLLLARAMQRWALMGSNPHAFPNVSASRARRNFARLYARYPEIAQKLRMTAVSAYPPL